MTHLKLQQAHPLSEENIAGRRLTGKAVSHKHMDTSMADNLVSNLASMMFSSPIPDTLHREDIDRTTLGIPVQMQLAAQSNLLLRRYPAAYNVARVAELQNLAIRNRRFAIAQ